MRKFKTSRGTIKPLEMTATVCELENGHRKFVDLPINSMVIFHIAMLDYQRAYIYIYTYVNMYI